MLIPDSDVVAAAVQTQPSHLASVGGGHVGYDAANNDILDAVAVWARHGSNLLTEESSPLVHLGLIAAGPAAIFKFPGHWTTKIECKYSQN